MRGRGQQSGVLRFPHMADPPRGVLSCIDLSDTGTCRLVEARQRASRNRKRKVQAMRFLEHLAQILAYEVDVEGGGCDRLALECGSHCTTARFKNSGTDIRIGKQVDQSFRFDPSWA